MKTVVFLRAISASLKLNVRARVARPFDDDDVRRPDFRRVRLANESREAVRLCLTCLGCCSSIERLEGGGGYCDMKTELLRRIISISVKLGFRELALYICTEEHDFRGSKTSPSS